MRHEGRLTQWNDERGFGFIEAEQGGDAVFVHVSALASADRAMGQRPRTGERLSFEVATDAKGRKQAKHVVRLDVAAKAERDRSSASVAARRRSVREPANHWLGRLLFIVLLAALAAGGWRWWQAYGPAAVARRAAAAEVTVNQTPESAPATTPARTFHCDGRTHCSQMTSCEEATYFLRNCPGTKMDGNHDGVPCEQQWCAS